MTHAAPEPRTTGYWWRTALFAVVVAVMTLGTAIAFSGTPYAPPRQVAAVVCGVAALGAVVVRDRHPVWFPAVAIVVTLLGDGTLLVPAMVALGVRRRDRVTLLLVALSALALVAPALWGAPRTGVEITVDGSPVSSARGPLELALEWVSQVVTMGAGLAFGSWVGVRRELVASLRERADRAEAERTARVREAALLERARIAREMHDVLGHKLSLLTMQAGALEVNAGAGAETVESGAAQIRETARVALHDLRTVIGTLQETDDAPRAPTAGLADVPALVAQSVASGADVTFDDEVTGGRVTVDDAVGRAVHRVLQEALTNAHRHAPGQPVHVALHPLGDTVVLRVENRVAGSPTDTAGTGIGLGGLAERVRLVGGTFTAGPAGRLFRVEATFPQAGRIEP